MISLALAAGAVLVVYGARVPVRPAKSHAKPNSLELALLLRIGLSSGLSVSGALSMASPHVDPATADLIRMMARDGLVAGLTAAMVRHTSDQTRLFRILADAHLTGAPLVFAVNSFISDELERRRAAALQRARVLPIRLTLPVALGLLPGFVLLGVAPQIVLALRDLLGQVAGL